jgi:sugar phosphate isomerase/epimerase
MASRRDFLAYGGVAAATALLPWQTAEAYPLGLPPGVQLWVVKDELAGDFTGTLRALKRIGYARVEAAGFFGRTAADFRSAIGDAGLECVSCHYGLGELMQDADAKLAFAKEVGVAYCVASSPAPSRPMPQGKPWVAGMAEAMSLADWQSNAEAMNRIGAKAKAMGLRFGYHNHAAEFLLYDGKVAYTELLRITDPELVAMELDLGWVAAAGVDPAAILRHAGRRIQLLHVKDIATRQRQEGRIADDLTTVPIGKGSIDWKTVFAAAKQAPIQSWFVEQEPPFAQPPLEGIAQSLAYLKSIRA